MKWIFLLIVPFFVWVNTPALHDGLFNVMDNVQVTRIDGMYQELASGQFPVRYIDAFGHGAGYFLFKFYSPVVYYIGTIFHYLGFTIIQSVKLVYLVMTGLGALGIWLVLKSQLKCLWSVTLGTIAFITSPYLYHDFFHRGSLTEASAFMLVPWVWWAYFRIKKIPNVLNITMGALSLGLVILTHSLTGVMVVGSLILLLVIPPLNKRVILGYLVSMILGFGLAAFSLIPALTEKNIIQYENNSFLQSGYLDHPVTLASQFMSNPEGKSAYVGATLLLSFILLIGLYIVSSDFRKMYGKLSIYVIITGAGGLFLMSPMSSWFWQNIIYLRYFQFPFRILTIVTTTLALGYAILVDHFQRSKLVTFALFLLLIIPLLMSHKYYQPLGYQYGTKYTVDDPCMTTTWANEYMTKWTIKCLLAPVPELISPVSHNLEIHNLSVTENGRTIKFEVDGKGDVQIGKYYFPEWQANDGRGKKLITEPYGESGLIKVTTITDRTNVVLSMQPSPASRLGDKISLLSLTICLGIIILSVYRSFDQKQENKVR